MLGVDAPATPTLGGRNGEMTYSRLVRNYFKRKQIMRERIVNMEFLHVQDISGSLLKTGIVGEYGRTQLIYKELITFRSYCL